MPGTVVSAVHSVSLLMLTNNLGGGHHFLLGKNAHAREDSVMTHIPSVAGKRRNRDLNQGIQPLVPCPRPLSQPGPVGSSLV